MGTAVPITGIQVALAIAGTGTPAVVAGSGPKFSRNLQAVLEANGTDNALSGYVPQAKSGFAANMYAHTGNAAALLNKMLDKLGIQIDMQTGPNGGATVTNCFANLVEIRGPGGNGPVAIRSQYQSLDKPVALAGAVSIGTFTPQFRFGETTSAQLLGSTYPAKNIVSWLFRIKRTIAEFPGANPDGTPTYMAVTRTEVEFEVEIAKLDESEGLASVATCPNPADVVIVLTQACGGAATLTLTAQQAEYDGYPDLQGDTEKFVTQRVAGRASLGGFSIT